MSKEECLQSDYPRGRITDNMFCAGYLNGAYDSCNVSLPSTKRFLHSLLFLFLSRGTVVVLFTCKILWVSWKLLVSAFFCRNVPRNKSNTKINIIFVVKNHTFYYYYCILIQHIANVWSLPGRFKDLYGALYFIKQKLELGTCIHRFFMIYNCRYCILWSWLRQAQLSWCLHKSVKLPGLDWRAGQRKLRLSLTKCKLLQIIFKLWIKINPTIYTRKKKKKMKNQSSDLF